MSNAAFFHIAKSHCSKGLIQKSLATLRIDDTIHCIIWPTDIDCGLLQMMGLNVNQFQFMILSFAISKHEYWLSEYWQKLLSCK